MKLWFEILSEFLVNVSAAWFGVALIEPNVEPIVDYEGLLRLTARLASGIVALVLAKVFRKEAKANY